MFAFRNFHIQAPDKIQITVTPLYMVKFLGNIFIKIIIDIPIFKAIKFENNEDTNSVLKIFSSVIPTNILPLIATKGIYKNGSLIWL